MESLKAAWWGDVVEAGLGLAMMRETCPTAIGPCFPIDPLQFRHRVARLFAVFSTVGVELRLPGTNSVPWTWTPAPKGSFTCHSPKVVKGVGKIHAFFNQRHAPTNEHEEAARESLKDCEFLPPPPAMIPMLPPTLLTRSAPSAVPASSRRQTKTSVGHIKRSGMVRAHRHADGGQRRSGSSQKAISASTRRGSPSSGRDEVERIQLLLLSRAV